MSKRIRNVSKSGGVTKSGKLVVKLAKRDPFERWAKLRIGP